MANDEHLARLMRGVEVWNRWRREHQEAHSDLSRSDLNWSEPPHIRPARARMKALQLWGWEA